MEYLRIALHKLRKDNIALDLRFLKRMPNLRHLKVQASPTTSGSHIKRLYLHGHLLDAHLNDLLYPNSSLEDAYVSEIPRESASGYTGFLPATLKRFQVYRWTGGDTTSNLGEPVFSSCQISTLSVGLPMESMPESIRCLHSLQQLTVDGCGRLAHLTPLDRLPMLEYLTLKNCAMQRLSVSSLPALRFLVIKSCRSLVEILKIDAPKLEMLQIDDCQSLVEIRQIEAPSLGTLFISSSSSSSQLRGAGALSNLVFLRIDVGEDNKEQSSSGSK